MERIITLLILIATLFSCKESKLQTSFTLDGIVKGNAPEYLYLEYGKRRDCTIVKNNKFQFTGIIKNPIEASFIIPPASAMTNDWFYLENNKINMEITVEKKKIKQYEISFIKIDTIAGTKTAHIRCNFEKFEKLNHDNDDWSSLLFLRLKDIIEKNPSNNYSSFLLTQSATKLNKEQIDVLFNKIDTLAISNQRLESLKRIIYPNLALKTGNKLFNFDLPNPNNKVISTRNFRGKVLYIDFWASWCRPCRKVNPELLKVYAKFKHNGFEILGVSIDKDIEKWKKAIVKDKLTWKNVIETDGFHGKIASKYNITAIPKNYLVDKNGNIISEDIAIDKLENFLKDFDKKNEK